MKLEKWEKQFQKMERSSGREGSETRAGSSTGKMGQPGKVKTLLDQADGLAREGSDKEQLDKAVSLAKEALRIAQEQDNPIGISRAHVILGLIHVWRTDFEKALEYNKKAITEAKRGGNCKALASATKNMGLVYRGWGQYDKAVESFAEAIRIADKCGEKAIKAWTLENLGLLHIFQGKYQEALDALERGLVVASELRDLEIEGHIRTAIGQVYARTGQYIKAAACLETALKIGERARKPRIEQGALGELGGLYLAWGKYPQASDYFQRTLERARRYGEKRVETSALLSQGEVYGQWGRYTDSLACFREALTLARSTGVVLQEMRILMAMGRLCSARGQYRNATELLEQALELSRKLGATSGEGKILSSLGRVYQAQGQYDQALAHLEQGLEILKKSGAPTGLAASQIANLHLDLGEVEKAEPFVKQTGLYSPQARLCLVKNDYNCAKDYYERLLKLAEKNRSADSLFTAYTGLGMACEGLNDLPGAAEYYGKAVDLTEDLRSGLDPAERETFFDVAIAGFYRTAPYEGLARVLVKMNRPIEAFTQSEYTRARIFAESISKRGVFTGLDVPQEVREADSVLADQLASLTRNLQNAYEEQNQQIVASLEPQVKEAREALAKHIRTLRQQHPLFAATRYPQPMDLEQTALKGDERVLAYHVTDSGLIIYLTEGKNLTKFLFKPISRKEIDELVRRFREPLEMKAEDDIVGKLQAFDFGAGKKLYDLLVSDALPSLPKDSPIVIVPDDSLGALPFEMLPLNTTGKIVTDREIPYVTGAEFFGDRNPLSYYQSVTALTLARTYGKQKSAGSKLLVFADPVFQTGDARYAEPQKKTRLTGLDESQLKELMKVMGDADANGAGIPRLPLTSELADSLTKIYGRRVDCFTGLAASKERFLKTIGPGLINYDKVVFATHGYFGKDLPGIQEPILVLSLVPPGTDGFLRMSEVAGLRMNADLVALTACQTGLGKKISGEGTMGMGRAFQYSGARCVLMSLWSVEQSASVTLVDSLFRRIKEGKSRLEALKLARQEVREKGYEHPFFWASFIMVGEAR